MWKDDEIIKRQSLEGRLAHGRKILLQFSGLVDPEKKAQDCKREVVSPEDSVLPRNPCQRLSYLAMNFYPPKQ